MNKFRFIMLMALVAVLGLVYVVFDGAPTDNPVAPTAQEEQGGGYSGLGK